MTSTTVLAGMDSRRSSSGPSCSSPPSSPRRGSAQLRARPQGGAQSLIRRRDRPSSLSSSSACPVCVGAVAGGGSVVGCSTGRLHRIDSVFASARALRPADVLNIMANQLMIARNQQMVWTKMMALASLISTRPEPRPHPVLPAHSGSMAPSAHPSPCRHRAGPRRHRLRPGPGHLHTHSVVRLLRAAVATA